MNSEDELLLLAHGIVTMHSVVMNIEDLDTLGVSTPHRMESTARKHLTAFATIWWSKVHGDPVWHDDNLGRVIEEAREWKAGHLARLLELREGKGTSVR